MVSGRKRSVLATVRVALVAVVALSSVATAKQPTLLEVIGTVLQRPDWHQQQFDENAQQTRGQTAEPKPWYDSVRVPEFFGGHGESLGEAAASIHHFFSVAKDLFVGPNAQTAETRTERPVPVDKAAFAAPRGVGEGQLEPRTALAASATTGCEPGRMTWQVTSMDTCSQSTKCYVRKAYCNGAAVSTSTTTAAKLVEDANCTVTQLTCNGIVDDLLEQHNASECHVVKAICKGSTPAASCSVQVLCRSPNYVTFGEEAFGFACSHDTLICGGTAVENPWTYDGKPLASGCSITNGACANEEDTCFSFSCTNETSPCTFHVLSNSSCSAKCIQSVNTTRCTCPADRTGATCKSYTPLSCTAMVVEPRFSCVSDTSSPKDELLTYDRPCFVLGREMPPSVVVVANVTCSFANQSSVPQRSDDPFSYWLETPTIRLSTKPNWVVHAKVFDFNSLSDNSHVTAVPMTRDHLTGDAFVTLNVSTANLPRGAIAGSRVYMELGWEQDSSPPGCKGVAMRRMILDTEQIKWSGKKGLSGGAIAGIVVGSVVVFAALVAVIAIISVISWRKKHPESAQKASK